MLSSFANADSGRKGERLAKKLDLSSDQIEKVKAHRKENKGQGKEVRQQMKQAKLDLDKAFSNGDSDSGLKAIHSRLKDLKSKQMDIQFNKLIFMKSVLNSEQREKFVKMRKGKKHRKGKR
jgi:Spy/CpxP family protein refolding chaperone